MYKEHFFVFFTVKYRCRGAETKTAMSRSISGFTESYGIGNTSQCID